MKDTSPSSSPRVPRRRPRYIALSAVGASILVLGAAALAVGQSAEQQKRRVDERLERTQQRLDRTKRRERVLTDQVQNYTNRVRTVEARLVPLQHRLSNLEAEKERLEAQLQQLTTRLQEEKERLAKAEDDLAKRQEALAERLRFIYDQGEPDPVLVLLQSGSLSEAMESDSVLKRIADRDGNLVDITRKRVAEVKETRDRIAEHRESVQRAEARTEQAAKELSQVTTRLEEDRTELIRVRTARTRMLNSVQGDRRTIEIEARNLQAKSSRLGARIVQAQAATRSSTPSVSPSTSGATPSGTPSSRGMIWPASGTLTSRFGPRWGRMHEGIDIACPTGTPVVAVASGRVILAGWQGGYGNLIVVDHGGGISTAYAHNSSFAASVGQQVGQGSVIAYSGNTGNSTGPHVHFEVRVNGGAVDPLGYL